MRNFDIIDTDETCSNSQGDNCCVDEVGELVQRLVRAFQMFERDEIRIHGFTTSQCYILIEINKKGSLNMNDLSIKMNLDRSTMTRIIDNLVRDEYITRKRDENDKRIMIVSLTEKGIKAASKLKLSVDDYYKRILKNIPEGKIDEVLHSASILLDALKRANPNCC